MKTTTIALLIALLCVCSFTNCHKSSSCPTGGSNTGNLQLVVIPEHHGGFVDSATIYIAYGTNDIPEGNVYNDSTPVTLWIANGDTTPLAVFNHLTEGNYYLYGSGYHASLKAYVKGGIPSSICNNHPDTVYLPTYQYTQ